MKKLETILLLAHAIFALPFLVVVSIMAVLAIGFGGFDQLWKFALFGVAGMVHFSLPFIVKFRPKFYWLYLVNILGVIGFLYALQSFFVIWYVVAALFIAAYVALFLQKRGKG